MRPAVRLYPLLHHPEVKDHDGNKNGKTGGKCDPGHRRDQAAGIAHHAAPLGNGRLRAEAEEAQSCKLHHHGADVQHRGHQNGTYDVRENMLENDLPGAAAGELCGLEPGRFLLRKGLAAGNPGVLRPGDRRQGDDGILQAAAQHAGDSEGKNQPRKSQEHVRNTHEHRINPPAVPAAEHADAGAEDGDDRHQKQRRIDAGPAAHDHTGEHVPSIAVGSEEMRGGGGGLGVRQILQIGIIRGQIF